VVLLTIIESTVARPASTQRLRRGYMPSDWYAENAIRQVIAKALHDQEAYEITNLIINYLNDFENRIIYLENQVEQLTKEATHD